MGYAFDVTPIALPEHHHSCGLEVRHKAAQTRLGLLLPANSISQEKAPE